jgi:cytochrome c biogenesis protein CcdA/thiol-disulfide isomerase/thioredoxin
MILLLLVAFVAGLVTAVSPCVLPILPIVLATGVDGDRRRPYLVIVGLIASFSFFTLASVQVISALNLPSSTLRDAAIVIIAVFGLTLLVPRMNVIFERATGRLLAVGARMIGRSVSGGPLAMAGMPGDSAMGAGAVSISGATAEKPRRGSIVGGLVTGVGLGLVWTPCAGPILGAITSLAVTSPGSWSTLALVVAYAIGAGLPLLAIALGGRALLSKLKMRSASAWAGRAFGALVLVTAGIMAVGADTAISADLTSALPNWTNTLQALERANPVQQALSNLEGHDQVAGDTSNPGATQAQLGDYGPAPDFTGIDHWLNSDSLTMAQLRGKVVLVDFWTYSCINCIRTLPYLESWYQKYAADGFVIVGVHSPEFAFEHDTGNVEAAIARFGITYPVAQDNEFKTWSAYSNEYWPAHYLIDANGEIRAEHFGEGAYDETEADIRALLAEAGMDAMPTAAASEAPVPIANGQTPETYLGEDRRRNFASDPAVNGTYQFPETLVNDAWAISGDWTGQGQYITETKAGAQLELNFQARDVYLVMSAPVPVKATVEVSGDGVASVTPTEDVSASGEMTISSAKLYHLVHLPSSQRAVVTVTFEGTGAQAYSFTFGS